MRIIDISAAGQPLDDLLAAAQQEDVVLVRDGQAVARLESFDDQDLEDLRHESSPEAIERGNRARVECAQGRFTTLDELNRRHPDASPAS